MPGLVLYPQPPTVGRRVAGSSLGNKLVGAWTFTEHTGTTLHDWISNKNFTTANGEWSTGKFGRGLLTEAGNTTRTTQDIITGREFALMIAFEFDSSTGTFKHIFRIDCTTDMALRTGGTATELQWVYTKAGSGNVTLNTATGAMADGELVVCVFNHSDFRGKTEFWVNGIRVETGSVSTTLEFTGFTDYEFNASYFDKVSGNPRLMCMMEWERPLEAAEIAEITRDPWSPMRRVSRIVGAPSIASGTTVNYVYTFTGSSPGGGGGTTKGAWGWWGQDT